MTRHHDVMLDRGLEGVVVRAYDPAWICRSFDKFRRHRIAGDPQSHRFIVNGKSAAEDFGAGIGRIAVIADVPEQQLTARFVISMQDMLLAHADPGTHAAQPNRLYPRCWCAATARSVHALPLPHCA